MYQIAKTNRVKTMLSHKDFAFLANKLQAPVIISDILNNRTAFSDDIHYGLHELISDFQPDTALLAIALGAKAIVQKYKYASPSSRVLNIECDRIIYEYGTIWVQNAKDEPLNVGEVFDVLIHTTDDLESIANLLEINTEFLKHKDAEAARICKILSVQARAQAMVSDAFMSMAEDRQPEKARPAPTPMLTAAFTDNVIQFPIGHAA
jgi:hypothetical protein